MIFLNENSVLYGLVVATAATIFLDISILTEFKKVEEKIDGGISTSKCVSTDILHNSGSTEEYEVIEHTHMSDICGYDSEEQIQEEIRLGEMELLAQLIEAEAGNQDFIGKCLVADVVLNRLEEGWGDSIEAIIFDDGQFSCIDDGGFDKAGWHISEESFMAAKQEYEATVRMDEIIKYFTAGRYNPYCRPMYKHGDHYFGC